MSKLGSKNAYYYIGVKLYRFFVAVLSRFRVSFQRSSRTSLCYFDKVRTAVLFPLSSTWAAPRGLHFVEFESLRS